MLAIAEEGEGLALEGLAAEGGDDAAVVGAHAGAVGVEDADDAGFKMVEAVVGHDDGFGEALGFIVDAARPDWVDVSPDGLATMIRDVIRCPDAKPTPLDPADWSWDQMADRLVGLL